jgi:hypothetical protein
MEKNGMLTESSRNDFNSKKAEYFDEEGYGVADADNKDKLKKPEPIKKLTQESE